MQQFMKEHHADLISILEEKKDIDDEMKSALKTAMQEALEHYKLVKGA